MIYYNEFDRHKADWLERLMANGLISQGVVDRRSISDVPKDHVRVFRKAHWFAGIGGWDLALQLARWPDEWQVWTGSCPCQPYSNAGKKKGKKDHRDLWPVFSSHIRECRPDTIFGEQSCDAISEEWLDIVSSDLEKQGYAVGAAVLGAHSIGFPQKRQRLYWVADSGKKGREGYFDRRSDAISIEKERPLSLHSCDWHRGILEIDSIDLLQSHGVSLAMARKQIEGFGDAIVPQLAAEFIGAFMDTIRGDHGQGQTQADRPGHRPIAGQSPNDQDPARRGSDRPSSTL